MVITIPIFLSKSSLKKWVKTKTYPSEKTATIINIFFNTPKKSLKKKKEKNKIQNIK